MRPLFALSLIALVAIAVPVFADEQTDRDIAIARAEVCVNVAKLTGHAPCVTVECKAAEARAEKLIRGCVCSDGCTCVDGVCVCDRKSELDRLRSEAKCTGYAQRSKDGLKLVTPDGKVYHRMPNGNYCDTPAANSPAPPAASSGCRMINGQWVCPLRQSGW